jgi:hypothetical protein
MLLRNEYRAMIVLHLAESFLRVLSTGARCSIGLIASSQ